MKLPDIDQPIRLTWHYAVAYVLLAGPTLWLVRPWTWALPMISQVTGAVVLPAVVLLLLYFPPLFLASLAKNWTQQQRTLGRFLLALAVFLVALGLTLVVGANLFSSLLVGIAAVSASYLLQPKRMTANQSTEPTRGGSA